MIKFTTPKSQEGRQMVGLGLSHANLELLKSGKPILVKLDKQLKMEVPVDVLIFSGQNEIEMAKELQEQGLIGPDTDILKTLADN